MPTQKKTPGVYIEEKSLLPPSVAQVETAIPAFIGYTEKAEELAPGDLHLEPKKVSSLLEFREYFGGAPPLNIEEVRLGPDNGLAEASVEPQYFLFHSLQLFFSNGGGECYVVSVGEYGQPVTAGEPGNPAATDGLRDGLRVLEKEDEPTILVCPDGVLLGGDLYSLQVDALGQCNDLQDRVAVFDLRESDDSDPTFGWEEGVDEFRNSIGTKYLKYGAAYAPHLRTGIAKNVRYRDFRNTTLASDRFVKGGAPVGVQVLPGASELSTEIATLEEAADDVDLIENEYAGTETGIANAAPDGTLLNRADSAYGFTLTDSSTVADVVSYLHDEAVSDTSVIGPFRTYVDFLYEMVVFADGWLHDDTSTHHTSSAYQSAVDPGERDAFMAALGRLVAFDKGADDELTATMNRFAATGAGTPDAPNRIHDNAEYSGVVDFTSDTSGPTADPGPFTGSDDGERRSSALPALRKIADELLGVLGDLVEAARERYRSAENTVLEQLPAYKNLVAGVESALSTLPPSGAIAGVYAQVDASRGVWKAPANVSLSDVDGLTVRFTRSETDDLNVDAFGKSINAIKFFTGRGHLVWGARTLAGNDNEWRYISVRRFFNMVEESVKKSTQWAVFEPNDAGTWTKVKGMIENFLTLQWRNGALQGAKPEEAFYVKVGLGETMTQNDILNGRMNVEIGMAVVRPAEFIILTFMHKMVES